MAIPMRNMGMDQYLLIPFLGGWTSIYQLFGVHQGYQVLTHPHMMINHERCVFWQSHTSATNLISPPMTESPGVGALCAVAVRLGVADFLHTRCRSIAEPEKKSRCRVVWKPQFGMVPVVVLRQFPTMYIHNLKGFSQCFGMSKMRKRCFIALRI